MEIFLDDNLGVKNAVKFERRQTSYYFDIETERLWRCSFPSQFGDFIRFASARGSLVGFLENNVIYL